MTTASTVRVGLVFPELLGTYGDRGNAIVLVERCRRRGIDAELVEVAAGDPIPDSLDVYLFGGGEDDPQVMAAAGMRESRGAIERAQAGGAVIFAVCAGFQLLGHTYEARDGERLDGLGLVDMTTAAGPARLIGEVVVEPDPSLGLPTLTGFENHGGRTRLGPGERPLGRVLSGGGNGVDDVDGVLRERIVGTYLHGPVLPATRRSPTGSSAGSSAPSSNPSMTGWSSSCAVSASPRRAPPAGGPACATSASTAADRAGG